MALGKRPLGKTGLEVSVVGLGAGRLGDANLLEPQVERFIHTALDLGVTLIDTARAYGFSEERLGRFLGPRRKDVVLSTKVGYGIPGHENWTGPCITAGIDRALGVMKTDWLDVVHLHSCPLEVLTRGECTEALVRAGRAGKIRVAAYSGDGQALQWAVECGAFASVQCSVSLYDRANLARAVPAAMAAGRGVMAKRSLGNAPWRFSQQPQGDDAEKYWERHATMKLNPLGLAWEEFALRFAMHQPGVSSCLVGTATPEHLKKVVAAAQYGPLPAPMLNLVNAAWHKHGQAWPAVI